MARLDGQVEITGRAWNAVDGEGVRSDHEEADAVQAQQSDELGPFARELHRRSPTSPPAASRPHRSAPPSDGPANGGWSRRPPPRVSSSYVDGPSSGVYRRLGNGARVTTSSGSSADLSGRISRQLDDDTAADAP